MVPGGGEGPPGERCQALGLGLVKATLEREDVSLEPGQQVQTGAEPGIGELGQMRVEIDHPRHDDPRTQVDGVLEIGGHARDVGRGGRSSWPGIGDASGCIDDDQPVGLMSGPARIERREQPSPDREWAGRSQPEGLVRAG